MEGQIGEGGKLEGGTFRYLLRRRRERHHLIQWQRVEGHPWLTVPVLYLVQNGDTKACSKLHYVHQLTSYFQTNPEQNQKSQLYTARSLGLFYDFCVQMAPAYRQSTKMDSQQFYQNLVRDFVSHLRFGSIQSNGIDRRGLWWPPSASRRNAEDLVRSLEKFLSFMDDEGWCSNLLAPQANRISSSYGRLFFKHLRIISFRRKISFYAHLKTAALSDPPVSRPALGKSDQQLGRGAEASLAFPRQYIASMLIDGFVLERQKRQSVGDIDMSGLLHALLLFAGGWRPLEPLHLWDTDVQLVGSEPTVLMHHPAHATLRQWGSGLTAGGRAIGHRDMTREVYLRTYCDMAPRHLMRGSLHAGFKGMQLNAEKWAPMYWIPIDGFRELFWEVFSVYITQVRPALIRDRVRRGLPNHPFLLVCGGNSHHAGDDSSVGAPYTEAAFRGAWNRALGRLHARHADPCLIAAKANGTTPHGARHNYGQVLADLGIPPDEIQECMHHVSPFSQLTYTSPSRAKIAARLDAARFRISSASTIEPSVRPLKTLAEQLHELKYQFGRRWQ